MIEIESRVAQLVEEFREIGASQMRDLPIFNAALDVEAVDFQALGDEWIGVLITPWFMSVIVLPQDRTPLDIAAIGRKSQQALPAGSFDFVHGGVDRAGGYKSLPLHSPMGAFSHQQTARLEARARLIGLLTPPAQSPPDAAKQEATRQSAAVPARRAFLLGQRSKTS